MFAAKSKIVEARGIALVLIDMTVRTFSQQAQKLQNSLIKCCIFNINFLRDRIDLHTGINNTISENRKRIRKVVEIRPEAPN